MLGEFNKLLVISLVIIVVIILLIFYLCGVPSMGTLHTTNLVMGIIHLIIAILMFTGAEKSGWDIFTEREIIEDVARDKAEDLAVELGVQKILNGFDTRTYEELSADELIDYCRGKIAGYKVPRSVTFRDTALPLSGAGKVLKTELRKEYQETSVVGV